MGRAARKWQLRRCILSMECPDALAERPRPSPGQALSRSLVALDQNSTIIAVIEMSQSSWLVGGVLPGIERQPRKKLEPSPERLLAVLHRWRDESGAHAMVRLLARVVGVGIETADMLVHETLSRRMRDRRAVARGACPRAGQRPDPGAGLWPVRRTRGARSGGNKGSPKQAMPGSPTGQARGLKAYAA